MTEIVVSKRDGVVRDPDGVQYRVHRGRTLADAKHPVVLAYPNDWTPMEVELSMPGAAAGSSHPESLQQDNDLEELRNDLAETEEVVEALNAALSAVSDVLDKYGELPPESDRPAGWLAEAVRAAVANAYGRGKNDAESADERAAPAPAPRAPRAPKVPRPGVQ